MNIHEYQAKEIFRDYGIPTPDGIVVENPDAARDAWRRLGAARVVVKAQIHAGGRGKGRIINDQGELIIDGGVKLADRKSVV